jgi:hypothetical protein
VAPTLKEAELRALLELERGAAGSRGHCVSLSTRELSRRTRCTRRNLQYALDSLAARGLITTRNGTTRRVTVSGLVEKLGEEEMQVRTAQGRIVRFSPETKFGAGGSQLAAGRRVHVVGWDLGEGVIEATRVAVCETDISALTFAPEKRPR